MPMNEFFHIVRTTQVTTPTLELMLLMVLLTITLVFKATRLGLLTAFLSSIAGDGYFSTRHSVENRWLSSTATFSSEPS